MRLFEDFIDNVESEELSKQQETESEVHIDEPDCEIVCTYVSQPDKPTEVQLTKYRLVLEKYLSKASFIKQFDVEITSENKVFAIIDIIGYPRTVYQVLSLFKQLSYNNFSEIWIYQKGATVRHRIKAIPIFDYIFKPGNEHKQMINWHMYRHELCNLIEYMIPGSIKAQEQLFDFVDDNNISEKLDNYATDIYSIISPNKISVPIKARNAIKKSDLNYDFLFEEDYQKANILISQSIVSDGTPLGVRAKDYKKFKDQIIDTGMKIKDFRFFPDTVERTLGLKQVVFCAYLGMVNYDDHIREIVIGFQDAIYDDACRGFEKTLMRLLPALTKEHIELIREKLLKAFDE